MNSQGVRMFYPAMFTDISKYKCAMCKSVSMNYKCNMGKSCKFAHNQEERRTLNDPVAVEVKKLYDDSGNYGGYKGYDKYDKPEHKKFKQLYPKKKKVYDQTFENKFEVAEEDEGDEEYNEDYKYEDYDYPDHVYDDYVSNNKRQDSKMPTVNALIKKSSSNLSKKSDDAAKNPKSLNKKDTFDKSQTQSTSGYFPKFLNDTQEVSEDASQTQQKIISSLKSHCQVYESREISFKEKIKLLEDEVFSLSEQLDLKVQETDKYKAKVKKVQDGELQDAVKNLNGSDKKYQKLYISIVTKLKNLLECPITLEVITDPLVLPSGITIDESAMQELVKGNRKHPFSK